MAVTKQANIKELIPDSKNFNRHSEYGMSLLEKSVGKFGMGRSILLDKNNKIIAGNGITETAGQLGIEDVAEFVKERKLKLHPHYYDEGGNFDVKRRVGCIGCPMVSGNGVKQYLQYPQIFRARVKAYCRWWESHPEKMRAGKVKGGQTLHQTWEEERRRVRLGLPQKTRLRISSAATKKEMLAVNNRRWYLKKRGYRIEGDTAYWNENTRRALILEKHDTTFKYRMEI